MPKQTRWQIKQELDTALRQLDKAQFRIILTAQRFKDIHPDWYERFCVVVAAIEHVKEVVKQMRDEI